MQLFNAVVNAPDDLDFRIHLRNDLIDLGIEDLMVEMRARANDDLNTQLNVFEDEALADDEVLLERYNVFNVNKQDPNDLFKAIKGVVNDTDSYQWFLRTLQELLLIPQNRKQRYRVVLIVLFSYNKK